ncbi:nitrilase [Schizosaccharomyces cryophilus OY26]|uniref:Nitrilase n=1 Tax=Schizosaccharomyces cryophilus (strain OY26 / ATCC MYA-4695 / CBS 11777 / NBRC 106824 / NRRL Y48691) TaxID=653667 RepID=S9X7L3_SCHCR|nr:nitrilase [Schizosaccharomyces cryophilus OY26]EPY53092.1 nitrilase [Schizosaccharomyces cryophilus OY26]
MSVRVCCVQMAPKVGDVKANVNKMTAFVDEIMRKEAVDMIIFPELATSGYECGDAFIDLAEYAETSVSIQSMCKVAKQYSVHIVFGFPERQSEERKGLFNSCVYVNPDGHACGTYQKVHLFNLEREYFSHGKQFPIFNTPFGKMGILICWDTAFPEAARMYSLQGADFLVIRSNWEKPYEDDWDLAVSARALDNCIPIAAANRVGKDKSLAFFGHSRIIGPTGKVLRSLDQDTEGYITAELDLNESKRLRREYYTFFNDRKPELYTGLTN